MTNKEIELALMNKHPTMLGMGILGKLREKADYGLKCKWKVSVGFLLS